MPSEPEGVKKCLAHPCLARSGAALILLVCGMMGRAQNPCDLETVYGNGSSNAPIRADSNHIMTYGQSWTSGDVYLVWTPWEETWQQLNGNTITSGASYN